MDKKFLISIAAAAVLLGLASQFGAQHASRKWPVHNLSRASLLLNGGGPLRSSCSPAQQARQAASFKDARATAPNGLWSNCPAESIIEAMHAAWPSPREFIMVNIGANKGYGIVNALSLWRPDLGISPRTWHANLTASYPKVRGLCGNCNDCQMSARPNHDVKSAAAAPTVVVHAVEPLPANVQLLRDLQALLTRQHSEGIAMYVHPGAVGPKQGSPLYFNTTRCRNIGTETCALDSNADGGPDVREVTTWTLSSLLAEHRLDRIDFLMIDTEGYDGAILLNSSGVLSSQIVRAVEFEYHRIGKWGLGPDMVQLKTVVDAFEAAGYSCYLQGVDGVLVSLTGSCWNPVYEVFRWSNVLCTLRGDVWHTVAEQLCTWKHG